MSLLLLEALGALVLLVFIVWWTMFSGRKNGELKDEPDGDPEAEAKNKTLIGVKGEKSPRSAATPPADEK